MSHYVRKYDWDYLKDQWYLRPHPKELICATTSKPADLFHSSCAAFRHTHVGVHTIALSHGRVSSRYEISHHEKRPAAAGTAAVSFHRLLPDRPPPTVAGRRRMSCPRNRCLRILKDVFSLDETRPQPS